jgi:hypothetical protein
MKIAKSEKEFPTMLGPSDWTIHQHIFTSDRADWLLSCELLEVPKDEEIKFKRFINRTPSLPVTHPKALEAGIVIPDSCYEVKDVYMGNDSDWHSTWPLYKDLAYFKDDAPANETETDKEEILAAITNRIFAEYRKHKNAGIDWSRIAAQKIYLSFQITKRQ